MIKYNFLFLKLKTQTLLLIIFMILWQPTPSLAIKVLQTKNNKLLILLENETLSVGDVVTNFGKEEISQAEITQIKDDKAIAKIISGSFSTNQKLKVTDTSNLSQNSFTEDSKKINLIKITKMKKVALSLKFFSNSTTTQQEDGSNPAKTESVKMTGYNVGLGGTLDYTLFPWLTAHGEIYIEPNEVKGTAIYNSCDNKSSKDCNAKITYLSMAAYYRYDIASGQFNPWFGLGGVFKLPITKSTTALKSSDIKYGNSVGIILGLDYQINRKQFIPTSFQYFYSLNTSTTVPSIEQFSIQSGYGWVF